MKGKFKDIEIGGVTYRLTKMDARTGSYIAMKIATILHVGEGADAMAGALNSLSRKDFDELQTLILARVHKITDDMPEPIIKANGAFVDEALSYDVQTVLRLTIECMVFNVGGFFDEAGLTLPN